MGKSVKKILEENRDKIKDRSGVKSIGLFGSCAREGEDERSDVDILIEFEEQNFDNFMDLGFYPEDLFDRNVDVLTTVGSRRYFRSYQQD